MCTQLSGHTKIVKTVFYDSTNDFGGKMRFWKHVYCKFDVNSTHLAGKNRKFP